jgi:hypothetical protein
VNWSTQFIIAVSSSITTALLLWILRSIIKMRITAERVMKEHRYLMTMMALVLQHLGLEAIIHKDGKG